MFEKVIIGIDARGSARDAIKLARELVAPGGSLTLAHIEVGYPLYARGVADERQRADRLLEDVSDSTGIELILRASSTSVGRGLHEMVERVGADLLVMGSTRDGLSGWVLVGTDTRDAINGAPCAVAIAPRHYAEAPTSIREVGVAYNGTDEAKHALAVGRGLARAHHATLSVFQAVAFPKYAYLNYGDIATDTLADVHQQLAAIEGVTPHAAFGDPAGELTIYSDTVDLLIVGSRGYGPLGRLVHSSTSIDLARSARCPLVILTRAARATANVCSVTEPLTAALA